jgi:hypothetical protein
LEAAEFEVLGDKACDGGETGVGEGRATRYQHHGVPRFDAARPIIELPKCIMVITKVLQWTHSLLE